MKKILAVFLFSALSTFAQTLSLSVSPVSDLPGSTPTLTIAFTDSSPSSNIAGVQWTLTLPAGVTAGAAVAGASSTAGQKLISCNGLICLDVGSDNVTGFALNTTALTNGTLATIPLTVASTASAGQITIGAAYVAANAVPSAVTIPAASVTFTVLSKYDLNGDGLINAADVQIALAEALGQEPCTSPFNLVGDGKCSIMDVILEIEAALGLIH